jgi:hypothetical protein
MIPPSAETFELDDLLTLAEQGSGALDVNDIVHELIGPGDMLHEGLRVNMPQRGDCWGSELHGSELHCDPEFRVTGKHLKDKFCRACREGGVVVPVLRVRAIGRDQRDAFSNATSEGLWNPDSMANLPDYRVVNHTQGCTEPRLIVFQKPPPESTVGWATLPPGWLHATAAGDHIRLWPSKGTLVPTRPRNRPRFGCAQPQPAKRQHTMGPSAEGGAAEGGAATAVAIGPHSLALEMPVADEQRPVPLTTTSRDVPVGARSPGSTSGAESGPDGACGAGSSTDSVTRGTHSTFLARFVQAHTKLRAMVEERLRSSDPMSPDQRDTLLEQVWEQSCGSANLPTAPSTAHPTPRPHSALHIPRG